MGNCKDCIWWNPHILDIFENPHEGDWGNCGRIWRDYALVDTDFTKTLTVHKEFGCVQFEEKVYEKG